MLHFSFFNVLFSKAETLVNRLLDKTPVIEATGSKDETASQGNLFFTLLGPVINRHVSSGKGRAVIHHLLDRADSDITAVGGVLVSLLDFVVKDKNLRKR